MQANNGEMTIKKAALLNVGAKYTTVILQILFTAILSRILSPEEYGIVAVMNVFIVFFQLFTDMGFGTAVIQDKNLSDNEVNDIFTFTIYLGMGLFVLFSLFSVPVSIVYRNRIYVPLGCILAFSLLFNSFNMIPNAIMFKNKRFVAIAIRTILVAVITGPIAVILALTGTGVYALTANSVSNAIVLFIWNEFSVKLKFKGKFNMETIKKVWGYSVFQFASQFLTYFNRNLDNLLIGRFFNSTELGYYNKSYTLAGYPVTYLPGVITPVMHPILSEYQDDKAYIYKSYLKILKLLSLLGCFISIFCFFAGKEIILIAFGKRWERSVDSFRIISLSLWMQIMTNTIAPVYQSIGNTKLMFKSTVFTTLFIVISILLGVHLGDIEAVSICVSAAYMVNFFISFIVMVCVAFKENFFRFLLAFKHEYLIAFVLILVSILWKVRMDSILLSFAVKLAVFSATYAIMLLITGQHRVLINFVKRK